MAEMDVLGDHPMYGKGGKMPMRGRHMKRAKGGRIEQPPKSKEALQIYNAPGSNEVNEATNRTPSFKRGGSMDEDEKDGGMAHGGMARKRHDRHSRGGASKLAGGGRAMEEREECNTGGRLANGGRAHLQMGGMPARPMAGAMPARPMPMRPAGMKKGGESKDHEHHQAGGAARLQRGGSARTPYSTASMLKAPVDDRDGRGYEGVKSA